MNRTKIGWTDFTWNPVTGCEHLCGYCYARRMAARFGTTDKARRFEPQFRESRIQQPFDRVTPAKVFVCSMADLFGSWVPADWIEQVLAVIEACPEHTFQLLTKNPARYADFVFPDNVWLGATVTNQTEYTQAVGFLALARGGETRFVSAEPLIGHIEIGAWRPDWVIIGPMTGPGAEHPPAGAITALTRQCITLSIPVFHKRACGLTYPRREFPA